MNRQTDELDSKIDLERILAALPPQQRRAVQLYAWYQSYATVAEIMGVSESAIKICFYRIRQKYCNLL